MEAPPESVSDMTEERREPAPLFAFELTEASAQPLDRLPDPHRLHIRPEVGSAFVWVHVDLSRPGIADWLAHLPIEKEIVDAISTPVQRGRLFVENDLLYGQLRDVRRAPEGPPGNARHGGALSVLIGPGLVITGRIKPLIVVERMRERLETSPTRGIASPFAWLTAFFAMLNSLGEEAVDQSSARLMSFEIEMLKGNMSERRDDVLAMHRAAMILAHDMAYKRTSMLGFLEAQLPLASSAESRALKREVERYAALLGDLQEVGDRCTFLLDEMRAQVEESTNRNLQVLTVFSVVMMPPTLIAGLWGINVGSLPLSENVHAFGIIVAVIAASIGGMLIWLRWLRIL